MMVITREQLIEYGIYAVIISLMVFSFAMLVRHIIWRNPIGKLKNYSKKFFDDTRKAERERREKLEKLIEEDGYIDRTGFINKIEEALIFSGFKKPTSMMPTEFIVLTYFIFAFLISVMVMIFTSEFLVGVIGFVIITMITAGIIKVKMEINYNRLESQAITFLDFASSMDVTSDEIGTIFHRTAGFLKEPLKGYLNEFYHEYMFGDSAEAFKHLEMKINHPRLKDVFHNTYICSKYSTNYGKIFSEARQNMEIFLDGKRERSLIRKSSRNMLIIVLAAGIVTLFVFNSLLEGEMFSILSASGQGKFLMSLFVLSVVYAVYSLIGSGEK